MLCWFYLSKVYIFVLYFIFNWILFIISIFMVLNMWFFDVYWEDFGSNVIVYFINIIILVICRYGIC